MRSASLFAIILTPVILFSCGSKENLENRENLNPDKENTYYAEPGGTVGIKFDIPEKYYYGEELIKLEVSTQYGSSSDTLKYNPGDTILYLVPSHNYWEYVNLTLSYRELVQVYKILNLKYSGQSNDGRYDSSAITQDYGKILLLIK